MVSGEFCATGTVCGRPLNHSQLEPVCLYACMHARVYVGMFFDSSFLLRSRKACALTSLGLEEVHLHARLVFPCHGFRGSSLLTDVSIVARLARLRQANVALYIGVDTWSVPGSWLQCLCQKEVSLVSLVVVWPRNGLRLHLFISLHCIVDGTLHPACPG